MKEENLDPKNSVSSNIKNKDDEIRQSALEEKINIDDFEKNSFTKPIKSKTNNEDISISSNTINTKYIESKTNEMSAKANERDPKNEMVLRAIGNSWVEIEDLDGDILMTRLMRPGETYVVPKINGLTFSTGNAGALSLSQGDVTVSELGEIGEIITARPLNIKAFSKPTASVE